MTTEVQAKPIPLVVLALQGVFRDLQGVAKAGTLEVNGRTKYNFRGIEHILAEVRPLMVEHGVLIIPSVQDRESYHWTTSNGALMHTVYLMVDWDIVGPDGSHLFASTAGEGSDSGDKATNKAMTAAYKYLFNELFAICDPTDDGDNYRPEEEARPAPKPPIDFNKFKDVGSPSNVDMIPVRDESEAVEAASAAFGVALEKRYLDVPYKDKDKAKAAGARWDGDNRAWYVPEGKDLKAFAPWLSGPYADESADYDEPELYEGDGFADGEEPFEEAI